jgi:upstream activation factor subunit UAF30
MKQVFGEDVDTFTMFTMNKYIGAHIHPFKTVDLTTNTIKPKKRKSKDKKEKKKRKGGGGLQAPYQLSPELARVTGRQILPRPRVVKKLWEYIRAHDLQDPSDKRTVICDEKLKLVMGGQETVTIFSMQKYITEHLLEKLDKSYYVPSDAEDEAKETEDEEEE